MIYLTTTTPILVAVEPTDFRLGIDGLAARCKHHLGQDPRSGTLFAFINRRGTMIRVLVYESNGFWLMTKRLSCSRFRGWPRAQQPLSAIDAVALRRILNGLIDQPSDALNTSRLHCASQSARLSPSQALARSDER